MSDSKKSNPEDSIPPTQATPPTAAMPEFDEQTAAYETSGFSLSTPDAIGPYKLLEPIGEGGMGTVWRAQQDEPVRRTVALKVIKAEVASKEMIARFEAERQAVALMDHPSIAKVLDAGTTESGSPYFVMELIEGIPFNQFCDQNRLNVKERLELFIPVCKAIQHAHQKGVIHRDLKPSNILVAVQDGEPTPKVIDFGLAKAIDRTAKLTEKTMVTEIGQVLGTIRYMSPEQASLDNLDIDTRTDIYSLGVMLYEILTGTTPVDHETLNHNALLRVLEIIREEEPPRPSNRLSTFGKDDTVGEQRQISLFKLRQILKGELDWVIMKALEKDRRRRYETANDLAADISRYLKHEAVLACPPSRSYRLSKFVRKNRGLVASLSAIGLLLIAGIAGTAFGLVRAKEKAKDALQQRDIADENSELAKKNETRALKAEKLAGVEADRARDSEADAKFQLANARWDTGQPYNARESLLEIPEEFRDTFEWKFSRRKFEGSYMTLYGHTAAPWRALFHPDGTLVASSGTDATIRIWDVVTGQTRTVLVGHTSRVYGLAFSRDGKLLASGSFDNTVKIWNVETWQLIHTLRGHTESVTDVDFSSDDSKLVSASHSGSIIIWDVQTGIKSSEINVDRPSNAVACSPLDNQIAIASGLRNVQIWDASTQKLVKELNIGGNISNLAYHPLGDRLLSTSGDRTAKIWDVKTGKLIRSYQSQSGALLYKAVFSPDGSQIAVCDGASVTVLDAYSGQQSQKLIGHDFAAMSVNFDPSGRRLVSVGDDNTVKLWDLDAGQPVMMSSSDRGDLKGVAMSRDGKIIASAGIGNSINVWNSTAGQLSTVLSGHSAKINGLDFSADGTLLASASHDRTVKVWDIANGEKIFPRADRDLGWGNGKQIRAVALSPVDTIIAFGGQHDCLKIFDFATGKELHSLSEKFNEISCLKFDPTGTYIAASTRDFVQAFRSGKHYSMSVNYTIRIWNIKTGELAKSLNAHTSEINGLEFSTDDPNLLYSGSLDRTAKIWDLENEQDIKTLNCGSNGIINLAVQGDRLFVGDLSGSIQIWDLDSHEPVTKFQAHRGPAMVFASNVNDHQINSAGWDGKVKTWNTQSNDKSIPWCKHDSKIFSVALSNDKNMIATGSLDKAMVFWDARTGEKTRTIRGHLEWPTCLAFNDDGRKIVSSTQRGVVHVWDTRSGNKTASLDTEIGKAATISFGKDGLVYAAGDRGKAVLDIEAERVVADAEWVWNQPPKNELEGGRHALAISGTDVLLNDLENSRSDSVQIYYETKSLAKPPWHIQQAKRAESNQDWFASVYHRARAFAADPKIPLNYQRLKEQYQKLKDDHKDRPEVYERLLGASTNRILDSLPRATEEILASKGANLHRDSRGAVTFENVFVDLDDNEVDTILQNGTTFRIFSIQGDMPRERFEKFAKIPTGSFNWQEGISEDSAELLSRVPGLAELRLNDCTLSDSSAERIGQLTLDFLTLRKPKISEVGAQKILDNDLKQLLLIDFPSLTEKSFQAIGNHPTLELLSLFNCPGIKDSNLEFLIQSPLSRISFSNDFTDQAVGNLCKIETLTQLHGVSARLTDKVFGSLAKANQITNLKIVSPLLTAKGIGQLSACENLNYLVCGNVSPDCARELVGLKSLKFLQLDWVPADADDIQKGIDALVKMTHLNTLILDRASKDQKVQLEKALPDCQVSVFKLIE
jgi:WD40 repeat protein/serine/threonine protein kinase